MKTGKPALLVAAMLVGRAGDPLVTEPGGQGASGQTTSGEGGRGGASGCAQGQAEGDGVCIDVTGDPENCGACGTACAAEQACRNGACDCPGDPISVLATGQAGALFM